MTWTDPNPVRDPSAWVNPTTAKSPTRSARTFCQSRKRPLRYADCARFATTPSSPNSRTLVYSARPLPSTWSTARIGPIAGTRRERSLLRTTRGSGRRSNSSNASRSKRNSVAGSSPAARSTSRGAVSRARFCSRWKTGRPDSSSTTISPSATNRSAGSESSARARSGNTAVESAPRR